MSAERGRKNLTPEEFDASVARMSGQVPVNGHGHADHELPAAKPEGDRLLDGLRDGAWLDGEKFPPLGYVVPGVIPEGSTLLVGPPKIGKSWFVLALALATAKGGAVLGGSLRVTARPVLYLALEDGDRRMQSRCRRLLAGEPIPAAFNYMTTVRPGCIVETVEAWLQRHPGAGPLAILDTLGKVMPPAMPGESAYIRDYRIGDALKGLADAESGRAVIINHHDRKAASDDFIDAVSGTHGLAGAFDTTVVIVRARVESEGLLKVTGRDVAEGEYGVKFVGGCDWQLDGSSLAAAAQVGASRRASFGLGDRAADILAFMASRPDGSATPNEVALKLGLDPKTVSTYLGRLVDAGRIERPKRGHYCLPYKGVGSVESVENE